MERVPTNLDLSQPLPDVDERRRLKPFRAVAAGAYLLIPLVVIAGVWLPRWWLQWLLTLVVLLVSGVLANIFAMPQAWKDTPK